MCQLFQTDMLLHELEILHELYVLLDFLLSMSSGRLFNPTLISRSRNIASLLHWEKGNVPPLDIWNGIVMLDFDSNSLERTLTKAVMLLLQYGDFGTLIG